MIDKKKDSKPHIFQDNETVRICGHDYSVEYSDDMYRDGDVGRMDADITRISIYPGMAISQQISTLIHEVGEAINTECELKHKHPKLTTEYLEVWQFIFNNLDLLNRLGKLL